jgi:hypothetical protein
MGSGRGETKRVQAVPAWRATYRRDTWTDFVRTQGVEGKHLIDYYLPELKGKELATTDALNIVQELFQDFIDIGMLNLPAGRKADDYEFALVAGEASRGTVSYRGDEMAALVDRDQGIQDTLDFDLLFSFNSETLMSSDSIERLTRVLVESLSSLASGF